MVPPGGMSNSSGQPVMVAVVGLATTYLSRNQEPLSALAKVAVRPAAASAGDASATSPAVARRVAATAAESRLGIALSLGGAGWSSLLESFLTVLSRLIFGNRMKKKLKNLDIKWRVGLHRCPKTCPEEPTDAEASTWVVATCVAGPGP